MKPMTKPSGWQPGAYPSQKNQLGPWAGLKYVSTVMVSLQSTVNVTQACRFRGQPSLHDQVKNEH